MNRLTENKIILVTRPTRLAELITRFNTVAQARFYVENLGADFSDYLDEDQVYRESLQQVQTSLASLGRLQMLERGFLPNYIFGPDDFVVTLGQDGLVANTLKYLHGQPVVAVNPDPARWDGQLLPFCVEALTDVMPEVFARKRPVKSITMAKATLNNTQTIYAVNDLFIGPRSHISARYTIQMGQKTETQSSSGVVVSTGLGSTGWLKSLIAGATAIAQNTGARPRSGAAAVKTEFSWDADYLQFTVREPFPTHTTGASLVCGRVTARQPLLLLSQMAENGVIFSDGIEKDFLEFNSGTKATITIADRKGALVL